MDCHENQPMLLCHCDHVRASSRNRYKRDIEPLDAVIASVSRGGTLEKTLFGGRIELAD